MVQPQSNRVADQPVTPDLPGLRYGSQGPVMGDREAEFSPGS
jgi:hypothetical protein